MNSRCIHGSYRVGICVPCCERRDRFAAAALMGLLAGNPEIGFNAAAFESRGHADALLAALDGSQSTLPRELEEARRRLREIEELVADQVDVDDGTPNLAARVQVIARGEDRP